jgi:photosystem II stability/assembly factor-like uncharacterized protein
MKKTLLFVFLLATSVNSFSQLLLKAGDADDPSVPHWVQLMYEDHPNVLAVEKAHDEYYQVHSQESNQHTAYYKHWRRYIAPYVQEDGSVIIPSVADRTRHREMRDRALRVSSSQMLAPWTFAGPEKHFRARYSTADPVIRVSWHANVYCIDQSISDPTVLYCGGENGGVYKSIDKGMNWNYVSLNEDMTTVTAIAIDPSDENDVLVTADRETYRTTDGGTSWSTPVAFLNNTTVRQFVYNPVNTQMVYAGTDDGLARSVDGGDTWSMIFSGECHTVSVKEGDPSIVYALRYDPIAKIPYFYKSLDSGATFSIRNNGWFNVPPADSGLIQSYGGRIALTQADPERIYVLLVGQSQAGATLQLNGQIGVYRSDDGGETWTHPHAMIGAPYNVNTHPNMMTFSGDNNTYNQIYYNTALIVSQLNADRIIVGGMSMWRSDDAGVSFQAVGGYVGPVARIHPDNQEFKIYKTSPTTEEMWWASDGGINYSTDFVNTHESRTAGIYGSAYWGFDQGWNDDIMAGGRYHNGNAARRDGYPQGEYQQLGGGEAASGYVNYSNEKKTYFSDIGVVTLPDTLNGITERYWINTFPNESYADNSSSRILFDWDYWNVCYLGKDNKIYKSVNGGLSFSELYFFGSQTTDKVYWIEQSRANPEVMYAQQVVSNNSKLFKSTDRGASWSQINVLQNRRELNFTLSAVDENELWISFPKGTNGNKIYHSTNSGANWTNLTTPTLDGYEIEAICHQFGTDGGVYLGTYHGPVFYRNNSMSDWQVLGTNLPFISYPLRLVPFYRDNKIRLATWHLGIWENQLYEPSDLIADFSANFETFFCAGDTISFVPHCVASSSATYEWSFPGAMPSVSTDMYPKVVYTGAGSFDVSLIVHDGTASDTITKVDFIKTVSTGSVALNENFESGSFPPDWKLQGSGSIPSNWNVLGTAGGFANSTYSMQFDNWVYDAQGIHDAVWTAKYDFSTVQNAKLYFDVAYTRYGATNSDTLEVRASTDCGASFSSLYLRGGLDLATAPQNNTAPFIPTATQWRTDTIDLSSLAGNPEVLFSFENVGHFGQILYLDNINVSAIFTGINEKEDQFSFSVFPNPVGNELRVENLILERGDEISVVDLSGSVVLREINKAKTHSYLLNTENLSSGYYFLSVQSGDRKGTSRFIKTEN